MSIVQLDEYIRKVTGRRALQRGLAVGDSWFQYPLRSYGDIQRKLASRFRRQVAFLDDSVPGRDARTLPDVVLPRLERVASHLQDLDKPFEVILASFGGNDVIGRDFAAHLKRDDGASHPGGWRWNAIIPDVARRHIRFDALDRTFDRIHQAYDGLVRLRNTYAPGATIIGHTYADVTPTDRAYQFALMTSGPWLWKPMQAVELKDPHEQRVLSRWLLESFSNLVHEFNQDDNVVILDTRQELPEYKGWWDNEIHPNNRGFQALVDNRWAPAVTAALGL